MAKIDQKLENLHKMIVALEKAVKKLEKTTKEEDLEFIQDSVVSRFKIMIESAWKDIKLYLENQGFADVPASPKGIVHFAREVHFLSQQEHDDFIKYLSLRNLASHLYDQPQYLLAVNAAPGAVILVKHVITRMEEKWR